MFDDRHRARANELSHEVIGAAIEVHRHLGPGLLESAYEACLCHELELRRVPFLRQLELPVNYKGVLVDCAFRIDILVDNILLVELKAVERIDRVHTAQVMTYLRLRNIWLGLLMNFNSEVLRDSIKRIVLG
jgi:GxxExxY protein